MAEEGVVGITSRSDLGMAIEKQCFEGPGNGTSSEQ